MNNSNTSNSAAPRARRGAQHIFTVIGTEKMAASLVRVHLGGDDAFNAFVAGADPVKLAAADTYVKLLFARPELGLTPPYDLDALRAELSFADMPVRRTYTLRGINYQDRTLAIDFVLHGEEGVAGPWAAQAIPGDMLVLSGPGGQYTPSTTGETFYLYIGDDSAIPAIAAALELLPASARGLALIEVEDSTGELPMSRPDDVDLRWIHRANETDQAAYGARLAAEVASLAPRSNRVEVFAHGEREAMKAIRATLQEDWGIDRRAMSLSAYWAFGRSEDGFQAEKREPIGQIFAS
ncbi:NADPH-dependent ferric siderophore reductase [Microbacterium endophyticum]|uniref:NADPH-dependent ferric siderophore reductase n=1 Tax=Microbacterium endophyticum TaxID=1526412 RepID=A0A7W4V4N8_9MICO|nr:siderophore-interacting protein [Microbacterium endophyticum]MBB2976649.1 NADPH-dependent ferric siderophore reductase [Microbacterium endophyticum]NIK37468.1 NADPH-dependent ferric siderophore reductase [Microbacterium endophyticum]